MKNILYKSFTWMMIFIVQAVAIATPGIALAQTSVTPAYSGIAAINKIIMNTPGISNISTAGQSIVKGAAFEFSTLANGARVPVMVTAEGALSAARIASFAGKAMKLGSAVGVAAVVIPLVLDATGIKVCPPPDFFCKVNPVDRYVPAVTGGWADYSNGVTNLKTSGQAVCDQRVANIGYGSYGTVSFILNAGSTNAGQCLFTRNAANGGGSNYIGSPSSSASPEACREGYSAVGMYCQKADAKMVGITAEEIATPLASAMSSSPSAQKAVYEETSKAGQKMFSGTDPVTVTAPPVSIAPQVQTSQITNPDGTTSTKVVTTTTTVTPKVTGSTVNNLDISYPVSTTTNTQITNNVTNQVTNNYETKTETATPIPSQLPTPQEPLPDFCATNSALNVCRNSTVAGECAAVTCEGDAIQCATLKAASKMNCREVDDIKAMQDMPTTSDGRSIIQGSDPRAVELAERMKGDVVDLSAQKLDGSGFLGAGACISDKTFTVAGKVVKMEFSQICEKITPLRYVVMAIGTIVAYMIVSRSVLQS